MVNKKVNVLNKNASNTLSNAHIFCCTKVFQQLIVLRLISLILVLRRKKRRELRLFLPKKTQNQIEKTQKTKENWDQNSNLILQDQHKTPYNNNMHPLLLYIYIYIDLNLLNIF